MSTKVCLLTATAIDVGSVVHEHERLNHAAIPTFIDPSVPRYQERIVQAGAVPAIIALSAGEGVEVELQRRCAAALCNLACTPANITRMVEVGSSSTVTVDFSLEYPLL